MTLPCVNSSWEQTNITPILQHFLAQRCTKFELDILYLYSIIPGLEDSVHGRKGTFDNAFIKSK